MDYVPPPEEDADVPAFCRALGVPGLADIHVHFLPPRMLRRVWEYFDQAGPLVGVSWPIRYKWTDGERVAHLRSMGVRMFSALAYAHRPDMAADLNAWTLAFARANPGCLPSATFYPEPGVARYVRQALDEGARIFKVHLQVGGFPADDPRLDPVWGLLAEAGVPVVVHAGHAPVGTEHTGPGPFGSLLARVGVLAEADDVFHLHHTEIDQALSDVSLAWAAGSPPLGAGHFQPIIAERKRMLKVLKDWSPPPALGPVPEALNDPAVRMLWGITQERIQSWLNPDPDEVVGVAASSGVVEGTARVLFDVSEIAELREGEILVVPVTAPSWAPVFAKIQAAVSDIGGSMSHAAIVAREYGMPAVVGCGDATKRIRTGDRIRVDGDRGTVRVLQD